MIVCYKKVKSRVFVWFLLTKKYDTCFSKRNMSAKNAGCICEWQTTAPPHLQHPTPTLQPTKAECRCVGGWLYCRSQPWSSVQRLSQLLNCMTCGMGADVKCFLSDETNNPSNMFYRFLQDLVTMKPNDKKATCFPYCFWSLGSFLLLHFFFR